MNAEELIKKYGGMLVWWCDLGHYRAQFGTGPSACGDTVDEAITSALDGVCRSLGRKGA